MSKAAQRRTKKAAQARNMEAFDLAAIPKRSKSGAMRVRAESPRDPRKTALDARCRQMGVSTTTRQRQALRGQMSGSGIGRCIDALCGKDAPQVWSTWQAYCQAVRTYRLRYFGQTGDPKGATITMEPERIETDQSHSVDLRDQDQRDRDAVRIWMQWHGRLGHLGKEARNAIADALTSDDEGMWDEAKPTKRGHAAVEGLRQLHKVAEKG